jgi:hypothetical protein
VVKVEDACWEILDESLFEVKQLQLCEFFDPFRQVSYVVGSNL